MQEIHISETIQLYDCPYFFDHIRTWWTSRMSDQLKAVDTSDTTRTLKFENRFFNPNCSFRFNNCKFKSEQSKARCHRFHKTFYSVILCFRSNIISLVCDIICINFWYIIYKQILYLIIYIHFKLKAHIQLYNTVRFL